MKAAIKLVLSLAQALSVLSATLPTDGLPADCGILGVMDISESDNPAEVRRCANHPTSLLKGHLSNHNPDFHGLGYNLLNKRDCWYGKKVGCSQTGWCYKACCQLEGPWCWTARGSDGTGDWISCKKDSDCNASQVCGSPTGKTMCKDCGCSCGALT